MCKTCWETKMWFRPSRNCNPMRKSYTRYSNNYSTRQCKLWVLRIALIKCLRTGRQRKLLKKKGSFYERQGASELGFGGKARFHQGWMRRNDSSDGRNDRAEVRKGKVKLRNEGMQRCHLAGTWEVARDRKQNLETSCKRPWPSGQTAMTVFSSRWESHCKDLEREVIWAEQ